MNQATFIQPAEPMLRTHDWILVSSSGGKDSQASLDVVMQHAEAEGVEDRVVVVHADLGRVEWEGARELAEEHAAHYGVEFRVERAPRGDLLERVEERGMWPSPAMRWCTSDLKRGPCSRSLTALARRSREQGDLGGHPCRILSVMGMRAEESPARAKLAPYTRLPRQCNGRREVWRWLPLHDWTVEQVWERNAAAGTRHHPAYDLGMPRLSCCFCIFAPREALLLAGLHNPELLAEYVRVEAATGHDFRQDLTLREIADELEAGAEPGSVQDWKM